jgi:predicted transposase/invertase (TIGR01784 family)
MPHYLDPKNDYAFKRIFGEHKHLCISLLNSLLPLDEANRIVEIEYLLPEHTPRTPVGKDSIVDVKCRDAAGRYFIVEMQMFWSSVFMRRIVFNAAQALVKQADKTTPDEPAKTYSTLQPVYTLAIVNSRFPYKDEKRWMYIYQVADIENPRHVLEGLNFIVVDLQTEELAGKIIAQQGWTMEKKRMAVLWLRFLKETCHNGTLDCQLVEDDTIRMAAEICEEGAFTREELEIYDAYWDHVRIERNLEEYEERNERRIKALEEKDKALEEKDKVIEDKDKALEDKDRLIEELKKQLTARSL